jgi:hypothetical protein
MSKPRRISTHLLCRPTSQAIWRTIDHRGSGDLVYVDHSGFYAGGVVLELAPMQREDAGLRRVLVKGAWKDCEVTKGNGALFHLLVTPDQCAVTARAIPARWIIDEHPHNQVDITFRGTTIITNPSAPANQFAA